MSSYTVSNGNENYAAQCIQVTDLISYPELDNLVGVSFAGYTALVNKNDVCSGDHVVVFPAETQLADWLCKNQNLYAQSEHNQDPQVKGYLGKNRRVKAVKLRGIYSTALVLPAELFGNPPVGTVFDTCDGKEVCRKFVPPRIRKSAPVVPKKVRSIEERYFPLHYDTAQFLRNIHKYEPHLPIYVSQKVHGCFRSSTKVLLADGTTEKIGTLVRNKYDGYVMGYEDGRPKPTKVLAVHNNGRNLGKWLRVMVSGKSNRTTKLVVTENHRFFSPDHDLSDSEGYVRADQLSVGDTLLSIQPGENEFYTVQVLSCDDEDTHSLRYDLTTETGNYVAGNILVHNSSVRLSRTYRQRKLTMKDHIAKWFNVPVNKYEMSLVAGSRRVTKDPENLDQIHYYSSDIWTDAAQRYGDLIPDNHIVYGELIGWVDDNTPIQKGYTYDLAPGEYRLVVYRVAAILPDGTQVEYSDPAMREFCKQRGFDCVRLLAIKYSNDENLADLYMDRRFLDENISLIDTPIQLSDKKSVDEGVVLRQDGLAPLLTKLKGPVFYSYETKQLDAVAD